MKNVLKYYPAENISPSIKPSAAMRIDLDVKRNAVELCAEISIGNSFVKNAHNQSGVFKGVRLFEDAKEDQNSRGKSGNAALNRAFIVKKDEFYTHYEDVAKEMARHQSQFKGKSILCNCDDLFDSAFFRYFLLGFNALGLVGLTATSYAGSAKERQEYPLEDKAVAYKAVVTEVPDESLLRLDGSLDLDRLFEMEGNSLVRLAGDGDFRSGECEALLNTADIVATNPPFSLFREYLSQLVFHGKSFIILGNMNAGTCKEVFPLFRDNKVWFGESIRSGDRKFNVPDGYPLNAVNCGVDNNGRRFIRVTGVRWFTNLDTSRRHEPLALKCHYAPENYPRYENYDAIEVGRTQDIPVTYEGIMGVPITFLDKYNPAQFEVVMLANGNARTNVPAKVLAEVGYRPHSEDRGGVGIINGQRVYARILIRWKSS